MFLIVIFRKQFHPIMPILQRLVFPINDMSICRVSFLYQLTDSE